MKWTGEILAVIRCDESVNPVDVAQMEIDRCYYGFYIVRHRHCLIKINSRALDGWRLSDSEISNLNRDIYEKVDVVIGWYHKELNFFIVKFEFCCLSSIDCYQT